jgi:hypothetical protein
MLRVVVPLWPEAAKMDTNRQLAERWKWNLILKNESIGCLWSFLQGANLPD